MNHSFVLDSWAVLAWLQGEPGGRIVPDLLKWAAGDSEAKRSLPESFRLRDDPPDVSINIINLGEVLYILGRRVGEKKAFGVLERIKLLPLTVIPADERLVLEAARVKMRNRVSYADAFAVATAVARQAALVTGDPEMRSVPGVEVLDVGT